MRVLLLPSAFAPAVGGVEELTRRLADRLTESGDAVEVWTNRHPADLPASETIDGQTVRRFELEMPAVRAGGPVRFARRAPAALAGMVRAARAFGPDVVHVQCFSNNGAYATLLSRLLRRPLVVSLQGETVMDDNDIYDRSPVLRNALRLGLKSSLAVTACSAFTLRDAERFGLAPGAGRGGLQRRRRAAAGGARAVRAAVRSVRVRGRTLRGEEGLRPAAGGLRAGGLAAAGLGLVIGGDGAARPGLQARVAELGLGDRVVLPGRLQSRPGCVGDEPGDDVRAAVARGAVRHRRARGAARGLPVIASSHGGATEIVNGGGGVVADPTNRGELAAAIERIATDEGLRATLSEQGRERSGTSTGR